MKLGLRLAAVVSLTSALWLSAGCAQEQPPAAKPGAAPAAGEKKGDVKKDAGTAKPADAAKDSKPKS